MKNLLTNRTLYAFEKWYYETHCKSSIKFEDLLPHQYYDVFDWLYSSCETIQHAFAVEFFDSVGIWRDAFCITDHDTLDGNIVTWNYTCLRALEKANEIFNNR